MTFVPAVLALLAVVFVVSVGWGPESLGSPPLAVQATTQESSHSGRTHVGPEWIDSAIAWTTLLIEIAGVLVIVAGAVLSTGFFAASMLRRSGFSGAFSDYRSNLGRGILLGLEFLVAADIISTVAIDPTLRSVLVLGLIVLIRTFLSFSLEVEITGRLPWQGKSRGEASNSAPAV